MLRLTRWIPYVSLVAACASAQHNASAPAHGHGGHDGHHHRFDDAARWAQVFDDPARDAWQRPDEVIRALALAPDARVADVGAGTGYFSVRLAAAVPQGRVWAIDIEPEMVRHLRRRADEAHLGNVFSVLCTGDDAMVPERVDLVLVVDTNHHIDDRPAYYRRLAGSLRPGGRVAIVDFTLDAPEGPPAAMRLSPAQVDAEMTAAGYVRVGEAVMLPRQYVLTYRVREAAP